MGSNSSALSSGDRSSDVRHSSRCVSNNPIPAVTTQRHTFGPLEQHLTLGKLSLGNAQTSSIVHCLKRLQIIPRRPRVPYSIREPLPLQLRIDGPRVDPQVILLIGHRRLILHQSLVNLGRTTELFGSIALFKSQGQPSYPTTRSTRAYSLSLQMTGTSSTHAGHHLNGVFHSTTLVQPIGIFQPCLLLQRLSFLFHHP